MTPGQLALIEAARLETARVYGGVVPGVNTAPASLTAVVAEAELAAREPDPIIGGIRAGMTNSELMAAYATDYATVREARKQLMGRAA